jgi:hypothetical protein
LAVIAIIFFISALLSFIIISCATAEEREIEHNAVVKAHQLGRTSCDWTSFPPTAGLATRSDASLLGRGSADPRESLFVGTKAEVTLGLAGGEGMAKKSAMGMRFSPGPVRRLQRRWRLR